MKKIILTLPLFAMTLMAGAQEPVLKARSIYDVNQDDKVTVQDVPALANKLLGKAEDKTAVDTQSLLDALSNLRDELAAIKAKLAFVEKGNAALMEKFNVFPYLLKGTFSVSATKKVQFTQGNLWWDGSAYHFEANQTDYPTKWNASHVGHFYWTSSKDYQSGNANYMPYAQSYSYSSQSSSDKFFCGEDNPLTVDGTSGCFAMSSDEWDYLIRSRTNAYNLHKYGVTVGDKKNCLVIAPDSFSGTLKASYTLDEISSLGLVCLPAAGYRDGSSFYSAESYGLYWSSTPNSSNSSDAYTLYFSSGNVYTSINAGRSGGQSLRLVRLPQ